MPLNNTIQIIINATDNATSVLKATAVGITDTSARLSGLSAGAAVTGTALTKGLTVPIVGVAAAATSMAVTFQQKMEMLHTNAGVAQQAIAGLSRSILDMAGSVGQSPEALAQAFYHIASAGTGIWTTAQQLDVLKAATQGAAIGQASLDDTTYSLTSAMASNVRGTKSAADMMAALNAIVGAGDMKLADLNAAIGTGFLATAATFGISIQSVGTALATLTDNGEHADEAATRLRMTWALMASPSTVASKQLEALGLTAEDAKNATTGMNAVFAQSGLTTTKLADDLRQPNGITVAMRDLQTHLENAGLSASETDAMLSKAFGGGRTDAALLTLLQNLDRMDAKFAAINTNSSQFAQNYADQQATASQKFKNAWSGIQSDLVKLGTDIMPAATRIFTEFAHVIQNVSDWYEHLTPSQQDFLLKAVGLIAVLGPAILIFGRLASAISAIIALGPAITAVISGIGTTAVAAGGLMTSAIGIVGGAYTSLTALVATPLVMGGIAVAAALADIALVADAISKVTGAIDAMNNSFNAVNQAAAAQKTGIASIEQSYAQGKLSKDREVSLIQQLYGTLPQGAHALGTNFAGTDTYLAGENGPELITRARGSKVTPAKQTAQMMQRGGTVSGNTFIINNNVDPKRVVRDIGFMLAHA